MNQLALLSENIRPSKNKRPHFSTQLLKWIGNKQRFAHEIISFFPDDFGTYYEPFLGSGAVLGTLASDNAVASDFLCPLMEIWRTLSNNPETLLYWYEQRWKEFQQDKTATYETIKARYNRSPNGADLLFLSRSCYGGVIRFRKDGYLSTPIGIHEPITPDSMSKRIALWHDRTLGTEFISCDFEETMERAKRKDLIYCDPPYSHTQAIVYGAQSFSLGRLFRAIRNAKERGVYVVLSIDGKKKSGKTTCHIPVPEGLFERRIPVNCGRSMLRRFQMSGKTLESEVVEDQLLLTW